MSDSNNSEIIPVLGRIFGPAVDTKMAEFGAGRAAGIMSYTVTPKDAIAQQVSNTDRNTFEEFMKPYGELLGLFSPNARRDSDWIGFNLTLTQRITGRVLSPFEVLRGEGVDIVVRTGETSPKRPDAHSVVLTVDAQPETLARVTTVLAKYGITPENFISTRRGGDKMNVMFEVTGEDVTRGAAQKFVAALEQKLLIAGQDGVRTYERPPSRRVDDSSPGRFGRPAVA